MFKNYTGSEVVFGGVSYPVVGRTHIASKEVGTNFEGIDVVEIHDVVVSFDPKLPVEYDGYVFVPLASFLMILMDLRLYVDRIGAMLANETTLVLQAVKNGEIDLDLQPLRTDGEQIIAVLQQGYKTRLALWNLAKIISKAIAFESDKKILKLPSLESIDCPEPKLFSFKDFFEEHPDYRDAVDRLRR